MLKLTNYMLIEYLGTIEIDDFKRIYQSKKQTQNQINQKITQLKRSNFCAKKRNSIITNLVNNFETNFKLDKKTLTYLIDKIEIDTSKKIYIYCKYNQPK